MNLGMSQNIYDYTYSEWVSKCLRNVLVFHHKEFATKRFSGCRLKKSKLMFLLFPIQWDSQDIRRLMGSTNQADPSFQNFMNIDGTTLFLFFRHLHFVQGLRSLEH